MIINLAQKFADTIYLYLKNIIPDLPEYFLNFTQKENEGLVIRISDPNYLKTYYGNYGKYAYDIYYLTSSKNSSHLNQVKNMDSIINELLNLKSLKIEEKSYIIDVVYINDSVCPEYFWVNSNFDSAETESQIYSIRLGLIINLN